MTFSSRAGLVLTLLIVAYFILAARPCRAAKFHSARFDFAGKSIACDTSDDRHEGPVILLLHGASGPGLPIYQEQARFFADKGFTTIVVHYFDATKSSEATTQNYKTWVALVAAMVEHFAGEQGVNPRKVFLVGYSLGASVALAAGSEGVPAAAIAEWYGSLPDDFFYAMKGMPPLLILHGQLDNNIPVVNAQQLVQLCGMKHLDCESHIYKDQGHGFSGKSLSDADARTLQFLTKHLPASQGANGLAV